jgi:alpha-acetolactate decarboxylase
VNCNLFLLELIIFDVYLLGSYEKALERKERFYQKAKNIESNDDRKTRKRKAPNSFSPSHDSGKQPRTKKSTNVVHSSGSSSQQGENDNQQNQAEDTDRANGIIGFRKPSLPKGRQLSKYYLLFV